MNVEDQVMSALEMVIDPELGINIVDLGLVYNIDVNETNNVSIKMTLTTPGCPLHDSIVGGAKKMVEMLEEVNEVDIQLVWEPAWTPDKMSKEAKDTLMF